MEDGLRVEEYSLLDYLKFISICNELMGKAQAAGYVTNMISQKKDCL